jgi:hypothetical protein
MYIYALFEVNDDNEKDKSGLCDNLNGRTSNCRGQKLFAGSFRMQDGVSADNVLEILIFFPVVVFWRCSIHGTHRTLLRAPVWPRTVDFYG